MQKILPGIVALLTIAVITLFVLLFKFQHAHSIELANAQSRAQKIAFFNIDSIQQSVLFLKKMQAALEAKADEKDKKINEITAGYQQKYTQLNKQSAEKAAGLSQEQQLQLQQQLIEAEQQAKDQIADVKNRFHTTALSSLTKMKSAMQQVIIPYARARGYMLVYGMADNDDLLYYRDESLNITKDIIDAANKQEPK